MPKGWKPSVVKNLERQEAAKERMNAKIREAVAGRLVYKNLKSDVVRGWLGVSKSTYYSKMKDPSAFSVGDLRTLCRELELSDEQILSFLRA